MKYTLLSWIIVVVIMGSIITPVTAQAITELHDISILNVFISEKYLECKKDLYASIEMKNEGIENEYVHVELSNVELGIDEFAPIIMIQPKKLGSVTIPLTLEEEPEGAYEFEVLVYFNNEVKRYFKTFAFQGCPETPLPPPTTLNLASESQSQKTSQQPSAHTWYLIGMVILIFILSMIYLLKLYIEKRRSGD